MVKQNRNGLTGLGIAIGALAAAATFTACHGSTSGGTRGTGGTGGFPPITGGAMGGGGVTITGGAMGTGGVTITGGAMGGGGVTSGGGVMGTGGVTTSNGGSTGALDGASTGGITTRDAGAGGGAGADARVAKYGDPCRGAADCGPGGSPTDPNALYCHLPGTPGPCGACPGIGAGIGQGACATDRDCQPDGGTAICADSPCAGCPKYCQAGCQPGGCAAGSECDPTHRCVPQSCGPTAPCPASFDCVGGSCRLHPCSTDAECANAGYCVGGSCQPTLGTCQYAQVA
jgi:hypothetical protein